MSIGKHFRTIFICALAAFAQAPAAFAVPKGDSITKIEQGRYDSFELDNGLKVLIVQNKDSDMSGASISVAGGQMSSPEHLQGLPHLLEHLVFLGSKSYPGTGDWHQFVSQNTGWSNASTLSDLTRFQFQVQNRALEEGLARLSSMLFSPNINDDTIKIGLSEVDKEFASKKDNEWQGILSVIRENVNAKHPGAKFGIGNKDSLAASTIELKEALTKYQEQYYNPRNMSLAVYTNADPKSMRAYIERTFTKDSSLIEQVAYYFSSLLESFDDKPSDLPLFSQETQGSLISIQTTSQGHSLDLRFEMPPAIDAHTSALYQVIAELIGDETKGSIIARLKQLGLAAELNTVFQGDGQNEVLDLYIRLTDQGRSSTDDVIAVVFDYINMLSSKEIPAYVQTERAQLLAWKKAVDGRQEVGDWLGELSNDMLRKPQVDWVAYKYGATQFTLADVTRAITPWLKPERMQAILSSPTVKGEHETPYFNTKYSVAKFDAEKLKSWTSSRNSNELGYPKSNPYLNGWDGHTIAPGKVTVGQRIKNIKSVDFKNSLDATVVVNVSSPKISISEEQSNAYDLAQKLILMSRFETALGDQQYFASQAGYRLQTEYFFGGVKLTFTGRREGIGKYMADVMQAALKLQIDQTEYDSITKHALQKLKSHLARNHFNRASFDTQIATDGYKCNSAEVIHQLQAYIGSDVYRGLFQIPVIGNLREFGEFDIYYAGDVAFLEKHHLFDNWGYDKVYQPQYKSKYSPSTKYFAKGPSTPGFYNFDNKNVGSWRFNFRPFANEYAQLLVNRELWEVQFKNYMRQEKQLAYHAGIRLSRSIFTPSIDFIVESKGDSRDNIATAFYQFFYFSFRGLKDEQIEAAKLQAIQRLKMKVQTQEGALDILQRGVCCSVNSRLPEITKALEVAINQVNVLPLMTSRNTSVASVTKQKN